MKNIRRGLYKVHSGVPAFRRWEPRGGPEGWRPKPGKSAGLKGWGARRLGPEGWGLEGWGAENFALFFPLRLPIFALVFSLGGSSRVFFSLSLGVFSCFFFSLWVKPRRLARAQTCTFEGPGASNTTKIPREDPQREREKKRHEKTPRQRKKERK